MLTGIDHVVILANDLEVAVEQYERLGFTVTPGGRHPRFTHNALIPFQDGTYLELIAFYEQPRPGSVETHRWHRHLANGGGLVDFALGASDVAAVQATASAAGVAMNGPVQGGRKRPDGVDIRWKSVMPDGVNAGAIPFVIEDETERSLRVPADGARHANGARGVSSLIVAVCELDVATARYTGLLGRDSSAAGGTANVEHARGVEYSIGSHRVEVVAPTEDGPM
ncbi:MAG TPA: VOC family protein, partial [Thermomicrobiales bacterium]|nr:VOC family protein [Thermomicrobiales bacterium]